MIVRWRQFGLLMLMLIGLMLSNSALAQTSGETTLELPDGSSFILTGDWQEEPIDMGQLYRLGESTLRVLSPATIAANVTVDDLTLDAILLAVHEVLYGYQPDADSIGAEFVAGKIVAVYEYTQGEAQVGMFALVDLGQGAYVAFDLTMPTDDDQRESTLTAAITSFALAEETTPTPAVEERTPTPLPGPTPTPTVTLFPTMTTTPTPTPTLFPLATVVSEPIASTVDCTVTAADARAATLRVGAGSGRTAVAFLPAGTPFTPIGRDVAEDGSVWFQMDKSEVASSTAADQVWLAAVDVRLEGNCDAVASVDSPGLIRPAVSAGTAAPGEIGPPPILVRSGRWQDTLDPYTNASCEGYANVRIPSLEALNFGDQTPSLTATGTFQVLDGGRRIIATNDATGDSAEYVYLRGEGYYYFSRYDYNEYQYNQQVRSFIVSPTALRGEIVGNWIVNGIHCSATVYYITQYIGG